MTVAKNLLIGIGSPHGDDAAGWLVAREIASSGASIEARCAASPADVLDWLDGFDTLEVCDAVLAGTPLGTRHRWTWPEPTLAAMRFSGSHDMTLAAVLGLAERLGRLPRTVRIWGLEIGNPPRGTAVASSEHLVECVSPRVAAAARELAAEICETWRREQASEDSCTHR